MRLVLHIGMGKTGTSTLQRELRAGRRSLAAQGICYPVVGHAPNHSALNCLVRDFERVPRYFRSARRRDEASMRQYGERFWEEVLRSVRRSDADLAVLSSEHFFYLNSREVDRLAALLRTEFSEVDVIAYVRSPASYYVALSSQRVRARHGIVPPSEHRLPIRRCLERYQSAFGGALRVRGFERSSLVGQDVVTDFVSAALPAGTSFRRRSGGDENESTSAEAMCVLQRFRRHRFHDEEDVFNPETGQVIRLLARMDARHGGTPPRLRPEVAALVTDNHRDDLRWLAETLGVVFPDADAHRAAPPGDGSGTSTDLAELLEVDADRIEAMLYAVVHEMARRSRFRRFPAGALGRMERALRSITPH